MADSTGDSEDLGENIQKRDLLLDLVILTQRLGRLPSESEVKSHSEHPVARYRDEFGGLFEAFDATGVVPDSVSKSDYINFTTGAGRKESERGQSGTESPNRDELINELQRINDEIDRIPYAADMNDRGAFTAHRYQDEFGSWDEALDATGIDKERALLEDMERITEKLSDEITQHVMNEHGIYNASTVARYFGNWSKAKDEFREWRLKQHAKCELSSEEFAELTGFNRDILIVIAGMDSPKGLEIKDELESYYSETIHHGRLYPNLDELVKQDLVDKFSIDNRSNGYRLTEKGRALLQERIEWENERWPHGHDDITRGQDLEGVRDTQRADGTTTEHSSDQSVDHDSKDILADIVDEINDL